MQNLDKFRSGDGVVFAVSNSLMHGKLGDYDDFTNMWHIRSCINEYMEIECLKKYSLLCTHTREESQIKRNLYKPLMLNLCLGDKVVVPGNNQLHQGTITKMLSSDEKKCEVQVRGKKEIVLTSNMLFWLGLCPLGCYNLIENHCPIVNHFEFNPINRKFKPGMVVQYLHNSTIRHGRLRGLVNTSWEAETIYGDPKIVIKKLSADQIHFL